MNTAITNLLCQLGSQNLFRERDNYIKVIREGVSGEFLRAAVAIIGEHDLFAQTLGVSRANLSRYYRKNVLNKTDTEGVLDILKLWQRSLVVFNGDSRMMKQWFYTSTNILDASNRPIDLCHTFLGRQIVTELLAQDILNIKERK